MTTVTAGARRAPMRPAQDRDLLMRLAATEYDRFADLLESLSPSDWSTRTVCAGWDVRAMAGHVLGMSEMAAAVRETVRQQVASSRRARRDGLLPLDALTALQVEKNAGLRADQLLEAMRRIGPRAARARRRTPAFVRNRTLPQPQVVAGEQEWWTLGYLLDVILTRDPFMHRLDIADATGSPVTATADHEAVLVDGVVREWAVRHGRPYALELTGPAGGRWGGGGDVATMDAFDFCRAVSGRAVAPGLLATQVPF